MKYKPSTFRTFLVFAVTLLTLQAFSQTLDSITKKFSHHRDHTLQEKIYVHLDQNYYLVGETAWFRIFYVDGSFHKPLDVSKVAYIEILDKSNTPVLQTKVLLKQGQGEGSIFFPATLQSGNYILRCYTSWMKNFSADFYFHKPITILNSFVKPEIEKIKTPAPYQVEFFPEGGHLVSGIKSKVAFKISDAYGKGVVCTGSVLGPQGDTIVTFKPLKFGLGSFTFTPLSGQRYRVLVKDQNNKTTEHPLPDCMNEGYVMAVDNSDNKTLTITITSHFNESPASKYIYLFAHSRNIISKAEVKRFENTQCQFTIETASLPDGISHFTILDEQQKPVCERLYFKQPSHELMVNAKTMQPQYGQRRKVSLQLQTSIEDNRPAISDLSVAVCKMDSLSSPDQQNIYHYLWLSSDLKGTIESPEYYFTKSDTAARAADNLMLTHGWRKFNWSEILTGAASLPFIPEYRGHILKGKIAQSGDSAAAGVLTYLSIPGRIIKLYASRSNRRGELLFEVGELMGQHKLVLQPSSLQSGLSTMTIENPYAVQFGSARVSPFRLSPSIEKKFLSRSIAMQVQDVYREEETAQQTIQPAVDSIAFYGKGDETYYLDNYTRFPVMEEVMREYVPGVFLRKRRDGFHFIVIDILNKGVLDGDPMILLDGVPMSHADKVMNLDPRRIRKLEVVEKKYFLGPSTMSGIVSFTTYHGDLAEMEMDPGVVTLNYEGLQLQREFYNPHYDTQKQLSSRIPDKRYLLYWNPKVSTAADGTSLIEFYTSDITGNFQVVIEGITKNGYSGSTVRSFIVK